MPMRAPDLPSSTNREASLLPAADAASSHSGVALAKALPQRLAAGRRQLIARAVGLHRQRDLRVLDATAGFGRDAMLLAALGAEVDCCERHPAVYAKLHEAIAHLPEDVATRMHCHAIDARALFTDARWDVIFLDPMYTPTKKQALPRAAAQTLRELVGEDTDADTLLAPARAVALRRVVVKRALRAPPLAGSRPMQSLRGNSIRFDLYAPTAAES